MIHPEELQDLLEIALRGASAVERRWIEELVKRLNAAHEKEKLNETQS